jgi:hypothetical protein
VLAARSAEGSRGGRIVYPHASQLKVGSLAGS